MYPAGKDADPSLLVFNAAILKAMPESVRLTLPYVYWEVTQDAFFGRFDIRAANLAALVHLYEPMRRCSVSKDGMDFGNLLLLPS